MKQSQSFFDTLKTNPKAIIAWCEREIKAYQDLIKLIKENSKAKTN